MRESQNAAQRTSHWLSMCQNVPTNRPYKVFFFFKNQFRFVTIWVLSVLSQFEFLVLSHWVFEFCHNLSFLIFLSIWVLSQFEFLNFVTIWVLMFCHNLNFVTIWIFRFCHIWVLKFCHNLSFVTILSFF